MYWPFFLSRHVKSFFSHFFPRKKMLSYTYASRYVPEFFFLIFVHYNLLSWLSSCLSLIYDDINIECYKIILFPLFRMMAKNQNPTKLNTIWQPCFRSDSCIDMMSKDREKNVSRWNGCFWWIFIFFIIYRVDKASDKIDSIVIFIYWFTKFSLR